MQDIVDLYVAMDGNDIWSGRLAEPNADKTDGPFATLERARDEIRRLKETGNFPSRGVTVWVRSGIYCLSRTFELSSQDSGTWRSPVVYRSYGDEKVVLTGGREIKGFKEYRDHILQCDVAEMELEEPDRKGVPAFELFFNGKRMDLARWPNHKAEDPHDGEWTYVKAVPEKDKDRKFYYFGDRPKRWSDPQYAQIHIWPQYNWYDQHVGIESIDTERREITLSSPTSYEIAPGRRYYVRNVFEELDTPGEWYFDRSKGTLYFWPPEPISEGQIFVSVLNTIVSLKDTSYVMLRGFTIECCRGTAVTIAGGNANTIAGCTIRNTGGCGISINGGTNNGAVGNDIYETGDGGISLSGGDRMTLIPANNYALNNHIHHYARINKCYRPGVGISGVGNRIAHNLIHDAPHNAILLSGNNHLIEYNEIHHVAMEGSDTGAFYMGRDWTMRGNVIRYNCFHDICGYGLQGENHEKGEYQYETPHGAWAVYLDDCASGTIVFGNVFYRVLMSAFHIGGGRYNIVENNIIVECYPAVHIDARWDTYPYYGVMKENLTAVPYNQPPYSVLYPDLAKIYDSDPRVPIGNSIVRNVVCYLSDDFQGFWSARELKSSAILWHLQNFDEKTTTIDCNVIWHGNQPVRVDQHPYKQHGKVASWEEWQGMGFDKNSVIADPLFIDPQNDNYQLRDDSPAYKLGFQRIPIEKIGLYEDEFRAEWPVTKDTRKAVLKKIVETITIPRADE